MLAMASLCGGWIFNLFFPLYVWAVWTKLGSWKTNIWLQPTNQSNFAFDHNIVSESKFMHLITAKRANFKIELVVKCVRACVFSRQAWSGSLTRSIWSLRYLNIWPTGTTTAPPMVITRMWSTNAPQSTLFTENRAAMRTPTAPIISTKRRHTTTTNTENCSSNTSAGAASNVCKGTLYSFCRQLSSAF